MLDTTITADSRTGLRNRLTAVLAAALPALTLSAGPASADVSLMSWDEADGTRNCNWSAPFTWLQYRSVGGGWVKAPGEANYTSYVHSNWATATRAGELLGGYWHVTAGAGINHSLTFAWCSDIG